MRVLRGEELEAALRGLPEWKLEDGKLMREWRFKNFVEAMKFVNRVGLVAEIADHHPDIDIRYSRVRLGLITHDASGITKRDIAFAAKLNGAG